MEKLTIKSVTPDNIPRGAKLFLAGMAVSGLGDGIIMVVAQLYAISLGFGSTSLGNVFMLKFMATALLTIPSGILADRYGRFKVLASGLFIFSVGMLLLLTARTVDLFGLSMIMIGLADATFVVLGPMYSSFFDNRDMDRAFGLQMFLNVLAISIGSLLGFVPPMLVRSFGLTIEASYWTLMVVATVLFFIRAAFFLLSARGAVEFRREGGFRFRLESKGVVSKFVLLSIIGNIGFSVFFSLQAYYANSKFGAQSDALGFLAFVSCLVQALASIAAPKLSGRLGTTRTIALSLGLSAPFYFMLSQVPDFAWFSAFAILRLGIANLASPLNSSLYMRLISPEEKATASSITHTISRLSIALATWLGGRIMVTSLDLPIYLGAGLYVIYAAAYFLLLRDEESRRQGVATTVYKAPGLIPVRSDPKR